MRWAELGVRGIAWRCVALGFRPTALALRGRAGFALPYLLLARARDEAVVEEVLFLGGCLPHGVQRHMVVRDNKSVDSSSPKLAEQLAK